MVRAFGIVALLLLALLSPLWGRALVSAGDRERDLQILRAEIAAIEGRLATARQRERSLSAELAEADLELALQARRVSEARTAHDLAVERARLATEEVSRLESELAAARAAVRARLAGLYRLGREGPLRLALAARSGSDLGAAIRLLRYLARRDSRAVDRYVEARSRSQRERERLEEERAAGAEWLRQEEVRRSELAAIQRRQGELVHRVRAEQTTLAGRADQLSEKERRLSALVDALYGGAEELPRGEGGVPLGGRSILDFKGALDWPLTGRVTQEFGSRLDPRYRTRTPHRGLEITATAGAAVRAVYPGKVLFAAPFEGYGPTVVVHHTDRVFSLYAGLAELSVKKGDVLQLADPVGLATGPLYFEIRRENRPEDPRGWLR